MMSRSRAAISSMAWATGMASNVPSGIRFMEWSSRSGWLCCSGRARPFTQVKPWYTGLSTSPMTLATLPSSTVDLDAAERVAEAAEGELLGHPDSPDLIDQSIATVQVMTGHKVGPDGVLDRLVEVDDLSSESYFHDPHPYWARMRRDQPLFHDTSWDSWILTRYADVEAVFKDFERYSNATYTGNTGAVLGTTLLEMDGMDHVVRRSIVAPEFVGKRLEAYHEVIDRNARDLIEPWRRDGRVDLVDAFTTRLPINVIIDMLDLPKADHHRFHAWYSAMMAGLGRGEHRAAGQAAHAEVCAYVEPFLAERDGCPGPTCSPRSPTARPRVSGCRRPRS